MKMGGRKGDSQCSDLGKCVNGEGFNYGAWGSGVRSLFGVMLGLRPQGDSYCTDI